MQRKLFWSAIASIFVFARAPNARAAVGEHAGAGSGEKEHSLAELYRAGNPGSTAVEVLGAAAGDFEKAAVELVPQRMDDPAALRAPSDRQIAEFGVGIVPNREKVVDAAAEVLNFTGRWIEDEQARRFVEAAGRVHGRREFPEKMLRTLREVMSDMLDGKPLPSLGHRMPGFPATEPEAGEYWMLDAGEDKAVLHAGLDSRVDYRVFDRSPFDAAVLGEHLRLSRELGIPGLERVQVEHRSVQELKAPERPLAVVRAPNNTFYHEGFVEDLARVASWIAPGGKLILHAKAEPWTDVEQKGIGESLLAAGWRQEIEKFGHVLISTFIKPAAK